MPERLVLRLEGAPRVADARSLSPNGRCHWAEKRKARQRLQLQVWAVVMGLPTLPHYPRARITFRVVVPYQRRHDDDNWLGGVGKILTDTLVTLGILPDDDSTHVEYAPVEWVVARGQRATEIRVEAI